jgi:PKD repeat protein
MKSRNKSRKLVLSIMTIIWVSVFGSLLQTNAMMPPVRNVTITNVISGSNIKYTFSVFDEQRSQTMSSDTGFIPNATLTAAQATDGVVTWIDTTTVSTVYYSIYDPILGQWKTGSHRNFRLTLSSIQRKNGIVAFGSIDGVFLNERYYFLRVYNPQLGAWQEWQQGFSVQSPHDNAFDIVLGDGVAFWTTVSFPNGRNVTVHGINCNPLSNLWQVGSQGHNDVSSISNLLITAGTVNYSITAVFGSGSYTLGYVGGSFGWISNSFTTAYSKFIPSKTTGNVPLKVYFWDFSLGGSSWNWNFGDGGTSALQAPNIYTYNSAVNTPYTATQTVTGLGGTASSTATINPTTIHSINGNVVNQSGFKVANATVNLTGTISRTTQTDSNGNYSFVNLTGGGNYTVTVSKNKFSFSPANRVFSNLNGTQTANFVGKFLGKQFDYDGDGKADLAVLRPSDSTRYFKRSQAGLFALQYGFNTDMFVPVDYDGDGKTDIAVFRPSTGNWYISQSSNGANVGFQFGQNGDIPVPADYDGDNKADAAVFRPSDSTWYVLPSSGTGYYGVQFGTAGDIPLTGDYDGDGKADIAVFRPSNATWYINRSQAGFYALAYGFNTDKLVPNDYDGDGKTDIAVFRPSTGNWYISQSSNGANVGFQFGQNGDIPVPADYDGDNKADAAVFRPSDSTWYILRSSGSGYYGDQFGTTGDIPLNIPLSSN